MADSSADPRTGEKSNLANDPVKSINVTIKTTKERQVIEIQENASIEEVSANSSLGFALFFLLYMLSCM